MWSPDRYAETLTFAALAHGDQREPGRGLPYVVHLCKVAMEVQRAVCEDPSLDADLAVTAALLHDCVEDAGVSLEALAARFGPAVTAAVSALTKDPALSKAEAMRDSLARLGTQPREARAVKLADRITNLEAPPAAWSREKRLAYLAEARLILDALRGASPSLEARLEARIAAYAAHCG